MPHVDEGLLHEYLDGELTGAARDDVLAHLGECAACRTRLEEERALVTRAGELLARTAPVERAPAAFSTLAPTRAPRWRIPAAWAASITIAFMAGWYAQGERPASRDVMFEPATSQEAKAPVPKMMKPLERSPAGAPAPPRTAARSRVDEFDRIVTRDAAPSAANAPALQSAVTAEQDLDAGTAYAMLGRAPALLPGRPVRRMVRSPTDADVVLVEQEWRPGVVLRLYERRASVERGALSAAREDRARPSSQRARQAPTAQPALRGENLARYVNSLRVEIAGPLASDSLARLLDSVE